MIDKLLGIDLIYNTPNITITHAQNRFYFYFYLLLELMGKWNSSAWAFFLKQLKLYI